MKPTITRKHLIKAFSQPDISRAEVKIIVDKYIGDSKVPPAWSAGGIRGTFGQRIYRLWARHLKNLRPAYTKSPTGRSIFPTVQSIHDFDNIKLKTLCNSHKHLIMDEFWLACSPKP